MWWASLENCHRVHGAACAVLDTQRFDHEQELPALESVRRVSELVERQIVEEVHAERDQREEVHRKADAGNPPAFLRNVGAEQRDVALLDERHESRVASAPYPWSSAAWTPGSEQQRVAGRNSQTRPLLPGRHIFGLDLRFRQIHQD